MNRKHVISLVKNPKLAVVALLSLPCFRRMPEETWLRTVYWCRTGRKLDLENPVRFNEKLQWLKLYDRRPEYTRLVDKWQVRSFVRDTIGESCLIPLLGVWDTPEEIDFSALPEQFVLKCNHTSGTGIYICRDRRNLDPAGVRAQLGKALGEDYYLRGREWPYRDVPRKILCEAYLGAGGSLTDYKFLCFGGEPKLLFTCTNRSSLGCNVTFFDMDWHRLPFERHYPADPAPIPKPRKFGEMAAIARKLSAGLPFVRVDLYEVEGKVYFGELTLYPGCGFEEFRPEEADGALGALLVLPAASEKEDSVT